MTSNIACNFTGDINFYIFLVVARKILRSPHMVYRVVLEKIKGVNLVVPRATTTVLANTTHEFNSPQRAPNLTRIEFMRGSLFE